MGIIRDVDGLIAALCESECRIGVKLYPVTTHVRIRATVPDFVVNEPECANVREIVEAYLTASGHDGLWDGEDCGCRLGDLIPCDGGIEWCKPAFLQLDGTLGPEKPKEES